MIDMFEADADLEEALLRFFRAHGVEEDALVEEVDIAFQELERQAREA